MGKRKLFTSKFSFLQSHRHHSTQLHIFKGLQIKRHFCHQFWILRIKDTYILDNVKKAYVSHKIMLFGSCLLSFVNLGSNSLSMVQWTKYQNIVISKDYNLTVNYEYITYQVFSFINAFQMFFQLLICGVIKSNTQ